MDLFSKLKSLKLLIIDDDEWVRDSLRMYFESEGCNIMALETAEEGLKVLKKQVFNIIFIVFRHTFNHFVATKTW